MADLTNSKPKDTYQRLVQVESDETNRFKRFQNGLGSPILSASFYTLEVANDIYVRSGSVYAQSFITTYTTSSTLFQSGSTKFGDGIEDKHEFTGSLVVTGSHSMTGSVEQVGNYTIVGNTDQTGDTSRIGNTVLTGNINQVGSQIHTGDTIRVGNTTLTGGFTHSGSINLNSIGDARLTGNIIHIGNTIQTGDTSITGNFTHSGSISLNSIGDVRLIGNITQIGDSNISGDLIVGGTVTAQEFRTELVTSATIFESGSTQFGNDLSDSHKFTGSLDITGSVNVDERLTARSVSSEFFMSPKTVGDMVVPANYNIRLFHDTEITGELFVGQNSDVYVVKYATTD